jgi:hypothetical protein
MGTEEPSGQTKPPADAKESRAESFPDTLLLLSRLACTSRHCLHQCPAAPSMSSLSACHRNKDTRQWTKRPWNSITMLESKSTHAMPFRFYNRLFGLDPYSNF